MAAVDLAIVSFSDPLMLIGAAAAGIPVVLHLLNRMRSPVVRFSSLRFLRLTAEKTARRRRLQHWLLLLMRMALFFLIAMTVAGPLVHGGSSGLAYGFMGLLVAGMLAAIVATQLLGRGLQQPAAAETAPPAGAQPRQKRPASWWYTPLAALLFVLAAAGAAFGLYGLASGAYFHGSGGRYSGRATACVVILDNSQSMLIRQNGRTRLDRAVGQTRQLLQDVIRPAQAALLLTNPGTTRQPAGLTTNTSGLLGQLLHVQSLGPNVPMQKLVRHATKILAAANLPDKLLVVVSDMARHAFGNAAVFSALGGRHIRLVLLPEAQGPPPADIGITRLKILRGHSVVGSRLVLLAQMRNNGDGAVVRRINLKIDGKPPAQPGPAVQLGPAGGGSARGRTRLVCNFKTPGWHLLTASIHHANDNLSWDDTRSLAVHVRGQVRVLVVGNALRERNGGCAFYADAALDPFRGSSVPWSIAPTYAPAATAADTPWNQYDAVFLCNVSTVPPPLAARVAQYANAGGRVALLLGAKVNAASYNAQLAAAQVLPGTLSGPVIEARGLRVAQVDTRRPLLAHLFSTRTAFLRVVVTGRWAAAANPSATALMALADGSPLLLQQPLGRGMVYTLLSAPSADWTNLANTSVFLPMLVRMALGPANAVANGAVKMGQPAVIRVAQAPAGTVVRVHAPDNSQVQVAATTQGGHRAWVYRNTLLAGVYTWQAQPGSVKGQFVVNPPGHEASLAAASVPTLARQNPAFLKTFVVKTPAALAALLKNHGSGVSLMPGVLAMVLILAVLEALFANRYRPALEEAPHMPPAPEAQRAAEPVAA